jgi:dienelactone hydrolase
MAWQRGLRAAVAYYPTCQAQFDRDVDLPLLILIGNKDDWTRADDCRKLQAAGFARPALVEAVYYASAYHSFDSRLPDRNLVVADGKSRHLAYDATAAPDAEARTRAWFARYLR